MTDDRRLLFDDVLAWKIFDHISSHPSEWSQHNWMVGSYDYSNHDNSTYSYPVNIDCNTRACYAGHLALTTAPEGTKFYTHNLVTPSEGSQSYDAYACDLLTKHTTSVGDISTDTEASFLRCRIIDIFSSGNSLKTISAMITELAAEYPSV